MGWVWQSEGTRPQSGEVGETVFIIALLYCGTIQVLMEQLSGECFIVSERVDLKCPHWGTCRGFVGSFLTPTSDSTF